MTFIVTTTFIVLAQWHFGYSNRFFSLTYLLTHDWVPWADKDVAQRVFRLWRTVRWL